MFAVSCTPQLADVLTGAHKNIEGVELDLTGSLLMSRIRYIAKWARLLAGSSRRLVIAVCVVGALS